MIATTLAAASLVFGVAGAASAQSAPVDNVPSMTVRLADVDLSSKAGARTAMQRIETAADAVCGGQPEARDWTRRAFYDQCRSNAIKGAVASVGRPTLSQIADASYATPVFVASN
jgi:UrcA family protein